MEAEKLTLALKAIEISGQGKGKTPEEIIDWAEEICKVKFKREIIKSIKEEDVDEEDVKAIYAAYPNVDIRNENRLTGKGKASLAIIKKRLREGYTKDFILSVISQRLESNSYLPNFNTFLNNLPQMGESLFAPEQPKKQSDPYHF